jgi:hypothetical protein
MVEHQIAPGEAMRKLEAYAMKDPQGVAKLEDICNAGTSFELDTEKGSIVYVLDVRQGVCWISAAAGDTTGAANETLSHIETKARAMQCRVIGFQTMRQGLARIAKRRGYIGEPCGAGQRLLKDLKCKC